MVTKKFVLLLFVCVVIISGVLGILRNLFLIEYEEQYHFWISITQGVIQGAATVSFAYYLGRKT